MSEPAGPTSEEWRRGLEVARSKRVAVLIVGYGARSDLRRTLRRIPSELLPLLDRIVVFDDGSGQAPGHGVTGGENEIPQLEIFVAPHNQGYGGNQKLGFLYAIEERFDVVVLLHADGPYSPEILPRMLAPFADEDTAAVLGSRMMPPGAARRGGMPLYKRVGNRILTRLENRLLDCALSEFHCGYRAYRVSVLAGLPFTLNTNGLHFDLEITIQLLQRGLKIAEVPVPTYSDAELSAVNAVAHALRCLGVVLRYRANLVHLVYHPKFDAEGDRPEYVFKEAPNSLHQHVARYEIDEGTRVLELGAGHGKLGDAFASRGIRLWAVDRNRPRREFGFPYIELDLDEPFGRRLLATLGDRQVDLVVALDVLEHLKRPEEGLAEIHELLAPGGTLLASTGNVGYLPMRGMLAIGQFNYGKRGILDLTHQRLFTIRSFRRMLEGGGFRVERVRGFGPPIEDMVGRTLLLRAIDRASSFLARLLPSVFSYQFLVEATRLDAVEDILARSPAGKTREDRG